MTSRTEISKIEGFLRRNPGCTFVFHRETGFCKAEFQVGVPSADIRHGGLIWGNAPTLDGAFAIACEKRDDRLGRQAAA